MSTFVDNRTQPLISSTSVDISTKRVKITQWIENMGMLKSNMGYFDFTLTYTANLLGSKKRRINIRPKYRHLVNVDKLVNVDTALMRARFVVHCRTAACFTMWLSKNGLWQTLCVFSQQRNNLVMWTLVRWCMFQRHFRLQDQVVRDI